MFIWLWQVHVGRPGDERMTAARSTVFGRAKQSGGDRVLRVDSICEGANEIVAYGTETRAS
jgi:hypothetical protein